MDIKAVPAAQYLRMSTEHQQYSLENQSAAIQKYAESCGFEIVKTYCDAAKSGLFLKRRTGLRQLLEDVVKGDANYRAVLVYDVSRWGRFQDIDESAHYEFLCKSAGVPVIYCAESFANYTSLAGLIMKALKRTMAGEFSRELSVKVYAGQKRLTLLGFRMGAMPGFGLRRMLVSPSGDFKKELASGEEKSIATDRTILVPGPLNEIQIVREIYRMFIQEKRSAAGISSKLNSDGILRPGHAKWDHYAVRDILTNPKYTGSAVFGRRTHKLGAPTTFVPKSEWIVKSHAFEPIIDHATFAEAQKIFQSYTVNRTDAQLLDDLRALIASKGRLSVPLIISANLASPSTYHRRFGSLRKAYRLISYEPESGFVGFELRKRRHLLREALLLQIAQAFAGEVSIVTRGSWWRKSLQLHRGPVVSVLIAPPLLERKKAPRWYVDVVSQERGFVTLLARLEQHADSFMDFHVLPSIDRAARFALPVQHPWLSRGRRLDKLSQFCNVVREVYAARCSHDRSPTMRPGGKQTDSTKLPAASRVPSRKRE